ncbi:putative molybdenum carrier protein [Thermodesulfobacteriota bacterium]
MLIKKIISGGQTGVDRAALDAAIEAGIPHGGWVPKGRKAEDGVIPLTYNLTELDKGGYAARTEKNVLDSDGTLIITSGAMDNGTVFTRELVVLYKKPLLSIDVAESDLLKWTDKIVSWVKANKIYVLNVAGPRNSKKPGIYEKTKRFLNSVFKDLY